MLEIIKDYKKVFISFILVLLLTLGFLIFNKSNHKEEIELKEETVEKVSVNDNLVKEEKEVKKINVDVKGAVKKAGVYSLEDGSIVNDVLKLAGLKSNATTKNINLSKKLTNEMVIVIFTKNELKKKSETSISECATLEVDISNCEGSSIIVPGESNSQTSTSDNQISSSVNINKASKEELMSLTGIGESKALAIIKYREENNGFKSIEDIMNVSGIGEALYNKIKDTITV